MNQFIITLTETDYKDWEANVFHSKTGGDSIAVIISDTPVKALQAVVSHFNNHQVKGPYIG